MHYPFVAHKAHSLHLEKRRRDDFIKRLSWYEYMLTVIDLKEKAPLAATTGRSILENGFCHLVSNTPEFPYHFTIGCYPEIFYTYYNSEMYVPLFGGGYWDECGKWDKRRIWLVETIRDCKEKLYQI